MLRTLTPVVSEIELTVTSVAQALDQRADVSRRLAEDSTGLAAFGPRHWDHPGTAVGSLGVEVRLAERRSLWVLTSTPQGDDLSL